MSVYLPNIGEKEWLQNIMVSQAIQLGLYRTQISAGENLTFASFTELSKESGGYQTKELANVVVTDALTAAKWLVSTNADGKAEAQYDALDTPQEWTMIQLDVDNGETAYGIFMWTLTLDFTSGSTEMKVGDTITCVTGGETAILTALRLKDGAWGDGDAEGTMCLKTQSGVFQAGAINNAGDASDLATITGDTDKQLILFEAFAEAKAITLLGQKIKYTPRVRLATT